jgi:multiple inositol-polyphosphate phosphatase/2,3-bisphosphoglycerate 3-phosphatase
LAVLYLLVLFFNLPGKLCNEEIAALQAWSPHVEEADQKRLAHEGEDEMVELAERFQNRFPQILPDVYTNSTFKVCCHN